jgi:hypothetical protein
MQKRIAIIGTHGVPAKYGGFETLSDYLCQHLGADYSMTVYCYNKLYPDKLRSYHHAKLIYLPIYASGFKGIFYDLVSYIHALIFSDIILFLSPVGSGFIAPLKYLFGKRLIVNHGGLNEWEREKLSFFQKKFAKYNHWIAAKVANVNIADNELYKVSLLKNFGTTSVVIKYGGDHAQMPIMTRELYKKYSYLNSKYAVSVSRAQIDNNLHLVLEAFEKFGNYKLVLISNWDVSAYSRNLYQKYKDYPNIILQSAVYDIAELNAIRGSAFCYIHSHSRCGSSPSLIEAMNIGQAIISYDVPTNRETTHNKAFYFKNAEDLFDILSVLSLSEIERNKIIMKDIAVKEYSWKIVSNQYRQIIDGVL